MKQIICYVLGILLIGIAPFSFAAEEDDEGLELRKSYPIQIYMGTCVVGRGNPNAVESQAKEMGFKKAPKGIAQSYLKEQEGMAWFTENEHGRFGIATLNNGLCSVFLHQGNPQQLQASMEAWLPPPNSGFTYKKELVSKSEYLATTSYQIYRGSSLMEQWVITVSNQPNSSLVAIMSYDTN